ncbi:MAG: hypothetical protein U0414_23305 [Polyangiaceae bacterium]
MSNDGDGNGVTSGDTQATGPGVGGGNSAVTSGTGGSLPTGLVDATGVQITEIAFYQAVKSTVMANGNAQTPSTNLVAARPAVVRVFVNPTGPSGGAIIGRLTLDGHPAITVNVGNLVKSTDGSFKSTINFEVPAEDMTAGTGYRVELLEDPSTSSAPDPAAHFPAEGSQPLAMKNGGRVKVTIIPVTYGADGSNRKPDVSQSALNKYQSLLFAMYPTSSVEIGVGTGITWNQGVYADGSGWDNLLNKISDLRVQSSAAFDEFYFGAFNPASSSASFCGGGCVAGLGFVGDPGAEYSRAAIGLGFTDLADETAAHEIGHNHGRQHSPCGGAGSPDPSYPYGGGKIGTWGLDPRGAHASYSPSTYTDLMGYCQNVWISDFTYEHILSFKNSMQGADIVFPPEALNQTYERVKIGADGAATWLDPIVMPRPPLGGTQAMTVTTDDGDTTEEGHFYAYDHLPGGVLFVKAKPKAIRAIDLALDAKLLHLVH